MEFLKISIACGDEFLIQIVSNPNNVSYETIEDAMFSYIDKYDPDTADFIDIVMNSFEGLVWQYIEPSYTIVV